MDQFILEIKANNENKDYNKIYMCNCRDLDQVVMVWEAFCLQEMVSGMKILSILQCILYVLYPREMLGRSRKKHKLPKGILIASLESTT